MRIIDLQRRLREVGRIRIGEQVATSGGRSRPAKLEVFRLTSRDQAVIVAAAEHFGGTPEPWDDAPDGRQWQVKTTATEMVVVVPPGDMAFSQAYEQWTAGGCKVRCDGRWDHQGDKACHCDPEQRACAIHTRLSVMLPDLPGLGVWRLDTSGYYAAVELGGVVDLAAGFAERGQMLPARLRLEQRSVKRLKPDGKPETRRFAVPVLDLDVHPLALAGGTPVGITDGTQAAPSFTPVPPDLAIAPTASVADQVKSLGAGEEKPKRRNAATPIPATGARPRTAAEAADDDLAPPAMPKKASPAKKAAPTTPPPAPAATDAPATLVESLALVGLTAPKGLRRARELAGEHGHPLPMAIEEVTGDVLDLLVADLGLTRPAGGGEDHRVRRLGKMWAMVAEAWPDEDQQSRDARRKGLIAFVGDGATSSKALDEGGWRDLFDSLELIVNGSHELHLTSNGDWDLRPKRATPPRPPAKKAAAPHRATA